MSGFADKFHAAALRNVDQSTGLADFRRQYDFDLDGFQVAACRAIANGDNVLVAAPTGSGKTLVAEFAAYLAQRRGKRLFYTTPIKALSNQKFQELRAAHGETAVGLLTGDNSINSMAPLVVMTTEVLRNMIYADSADLRELDYVIMDEVHYLADKFRGAVWEESLIHLPEHVRVVALSATVSNAEEFGAWITQVRGSTEVVVEEHRPIPLHQHVFHDGQLLDLFAISGAGAGSRVRVNPEIVALQRREREVHFGGHGRQSRRGFGPRVSRVDVVDALRRADLLPAITFIFSRAGCDAAVEQCLSAGLRLTSASERLEIRSIIDRRCEVLPDSDLNVLGFLHWRDALESGFAAHHAGMIPLFKEAVETLFQRGLLKVVFATETLALGINMPARTVVVERLAKWNGEGHAAITAGEYTQLTGRAGRRGIDTEGHAVVHWADDVDPQSLASLASTRSYPLRSAFRPSYNMAVNLISAYGLQEARLLNERSFAQFQADAGNRGIADAMRQNEGASARLQERLACHLGSFTAYAQMLDELSRIEKSAAATARTSRNAEILAALERLRRGDVVRIDRGRRAGIAVVISPVKDAGGRVTVLDRNRQVRRLGIADFSRPPRPTSRIDVPPAFAARSPASRKQLADALASARHADVNLAAEVATAPGEASDAEITLLRHAVRAHPCHGCHDRADHLDVWRQHKQLAKQHATLSRRRDSRRGAVAREFDRICDVLLNLGYLAHSDNPVITHAGELLAGIHGELDLVTAESIRQGAFDGLDAAGLAALSSALVYETRGSETGPPPVLPSALRMSLERVHRAWGTVVSAETDASMHPSRAPDTHIMPAILAWARGATLAHALSECDLQPGDFVRWCRQVIDVLGHLARARGAEGSLSAQARAAAASLDRDIVKVTSLDADDSRSFSA